MTFDEFKATGRDVADLSTVEGMDGPEGVAGRVYLDFLFIEDTTSWNAVRSAKRWYTIVGNKEYSLNAISPIEYVLFKFAVDEGMIVRTLPSGGR